MLLLSLTAAFSKLRPPHCESGSNLCKKPSEVQISVLYISLALASLGNSGTRFTIGSLGAKQFDKPKHQGIFFNWYIFVMYTSSVVCSILIVYIQDDISWAWGFGICLAGNIIGLALFLAGNNIYRRLKPQGSPFASLGRVIVAATRKRNMLLSINSEDHCQDTQTNAFVTPKKFFRFLNHAAMKAEGDTEQDGSIRKPWRICTVREVEDFKGLIKMLPLWLSGILIPAGTMPVFISIATCITIFLSDRFLFPMWENWTHRPITPLQRVGIGHVMDILSMVALALVEAKRLNIVRQNNLQDQDNAVVVVPMSVFWLVP
ncbi:hypothetical protein ACH5RR_009951 [Cinchona calisaya]|uniref:Uncharacterized protein n=1 Tax=Cinchona calisaya TaxID=153742 RepID=A0ABD3AH94_9GENT